MDTAMRRVAASAGFHDWDLDLMINFPSARLIPLSSVDRLLRAPRSVDSLVPALRKDLEVSGIDGIQQLPLWKWLDVDSVSRKQSDSPEGWLRMAGEGLKSYLRPLSKSDKDFLVREVPSLLRQSDEDTSLTPVQSDSMRQRQDAYTDEVIRLASKLSRVDLVQASGALDEALFMLLNRGRDSGWTAVKRDLEKLKKRGILVEIGTEGSDVHRLKSGIVFDPGGDDRYEFATVPMPGSWLLVIDASGNDLYHASDTTGGSAAFLSLQIIADMKGDDRYIGRDFSFGSAMLGYSRLFDAAGNDLYYGRSASLGFAFEGIGILQDVSGNDVYSASYLSEGSSSTRGLGVLLDQKGNDQYLARPDFVDDLRYRDHFLSLSQGFSTGFSPKHPGGIGVLWDQNGEDLYSADIFGQGTGYWFAWGLLMDDSGNDRFVAHQYAQGAGVHFAAGTLWDRAGNDLRASKGVSQGCGHDGGFGLLVDEAGNDRTVGVDMSIGAGSANGLGVHVDLSGDDDYDALNPKMTLGHGDLRRDRGSMGFFLDIGGKDRYPLEIKNGSAWKVYDTKTRGYGYGLDTE
ncbi:MAG TPA: hypothetical protein DCQ83_02080 [Fibrobacteres bacterium]|nr:hypothetical protein [Fibrobacterota bacterium]